MCPPLLSTRICLRPGVRSALFPCRHGQTLGQGHAARVGLACKPDESLAAAVPTGYASEGSIGRGVISDPLHCRQVSDQLGRPK